MTRYYLHFNHVMPQPHEIWRRDDDRPDFIVATFTFGSDANRYLKECNTTEECNSDETTD